MKKTRAFLSLNFDDHLKVKIAEIQKELQKKLSGYLIKWENPEKFHMTVRFLGDVYENVLSEIIRGLEETKFGFRSINFNSNGIGFFPNARRPNVVFTALEEEGNKSEILVNEIDKVITGVGINPDKKFVAHITLGRFRRENRSGVNPDDLIDFEPFSVRFNSFYLMESKLDSKGSRYYPIKKFYFQ